MAVTGGVRRLGRLDILIANVGIMFHCLATGRDDEACRDAVDVMLVGAETSATPRAKHGVIGLMHMYANHLAPQSIRVSTSHPTGVDTPMPAGFHESAAAADPRLTAGLGNPMPVGTIDVSNAVASLISDAAGYVTGITLPVDAGMSN